MASDELVRERSLYIGSFIAAILYGESKTIDWHLQKELT